MGGARKEREKKVRKRVGEGATERMQRKKERERIRQGEGGRERERIIYKSERGCAPAEGRKTFI